MKKLLILFICLLLTVPAFTKTIKLKNGTTIEGTIVAQNDKFVKICLADGSYKIYSYDELINVAPIEGKQYYRDAQKSKNIRQKYTKKNSARIINKARYKLYIPSGINSYVKYPLVVALSPTANAQSMISTWKETAEKYKWIILASKESRNEIGR